MNPGRLPGFAVLALAATIASCTATTPAPLPPAGIEAPEAGIRLPGEPVRLVVWSARALPPRIAVRARTLPGVHAVGVRRTALVDLRRTIGATRPLRAGPPGSILPISIETVGARLFESVARFRPAARALRAGRAVIPDATARMRGLGVGDRIVAAARRTVVRLRVGALIDDDATRAEVIVPRRAGRAFGVGPSRGIILSVEPGSEASAIRGLERVLGRFPARIGSSTEAGAPPATQRLLPLRDIKAAFGEFWFRPGYGIGITIQPGWVHRNIVKTRLPLLGVVKAHRRLVPQLRGAMRELRARGLGRLVRTYDGCYNPRFQVSGNGDLSRHAFGAAIDINAGSNGYGARPHQDRRLVAVMERWGFTWGGRWTVPDGMHFEFVRFPAA